MLENSGIINRISEFLENQPDLAFAYLFGSRARGNARHNSDVDLAILFRPGLSKFQRFDRILELGIELERLLKLRFDIVDLETAPLVLKHHILKNRVCVLNNDESLRILFEVDSRRKYLDFKPRLDLRTDALLKKLQGDVPLG